MRTFCIDCGAPGTTGTRCDKCDGAHRANVNRRQTVLRRSRGGRPQYSGAWARQSRAIRESAVVCWLCGDGPRDDDPWQADHLLPASMGGTGGPALPAHRSCNVARSNRARAQGGTQTYPRRNMGRIADS